jgi:hypothetical protein
VGSTRDKFASLGFDGKDKRHIGVYVMPAAEVTNGELTQTHKIHIGNGTGDMRVSYPTELIFASMIEPWVFERFTLAGRDWDGIAVLPDDGDFEVSFGDPTRQSVVITDTPAHFFTHRYQLVMRNTDTGEIVTTDPGVANDDDQGSIP